jgi:hypothetical protein
MSDYYFELMPGGGRRTTVPLGENILTFCTRYNYSAEVWSVDIEDANGEVLLAGLMLVPNVDLLYPHQRYQKLIGSLIPVEYAVGDHKNPELLGTKVKIIWLPPEEE